MENDNTEKEKKQVTRFTRIWHELRIRNNLSFIEYCLLDSIYQLGSNPKYNYWCVQSQKHFADIYGCSRIHINNLCKKHIESGYLERPDERRTKDTRIRTTQKYYDEFIVFIPSAMTSIKNIDNLACKESLHACKESLHGSKLSLHNSYSYTDSNKPVNLLDNLKGEDIPCFDSNNELITFLETKGKDKEEIARFIYEQNENCPKAYAAFNMAREKYPAKSGNYICAVAYKILKDNQYVHESFD